ISFRLTWDGCSSHLPFGGVLYFRSEAREVLGSETARVHLAARRRGGRMATRGARAGAGNAGNRIPQRRISWLVCGPCARISPGLEGDRLHRGPKLGNRISLGGG